MEEANHYLVDIETNEKTYLRIPETYTFGSENVIIVKENATGDGAIVINNGKTQAEISVEGTLFLGPAFYEENPSPTDEECFEQLNIEINNILTLKDDRKIVDFISPFTKKGSNQYYIKSAFFTPLQDSASCGFTMVLSENRKAYLGLTELDIKLENGYIRQLVDAQASLAVGTTGTTDRAEIVGPKFISGLTVSKYIEGQTGTPTPLSDLYKRLVKFPYLSIKTKVSEIYNNLLGREIKLPEPYTYASRIDVAPTGDE